MRRMPTGIRPCTFACAHDAGHATLSTERLAAAKGAEGWEAVARVEAARGAAAKAEEVRAAGAMSAAAALAVWPTRRFASCAPEVIRRAWNDVRKELRTHSRARAVVTVHCAAVLACRWVGRGGCDRWRA